MILSKELINRVYKEKECIGFDYQLKDEKENVIINAHYEKKAPTEWLLRIIFDRYGATDSQAYYFWYSIPKKQMDLTMICAIGLGYFLTNIKEEIQRKSTISFAVGDSIRDMVG